MKLRYLKKKSRRLQRKLLEKKTKKKMIAKNKKRTEVKVPKMRKTFKKDKELIIIWKIKRRNIINKI